MTAFVACRGVRPWLFPALGCLAAVFAVLAQPTHVLAEEAATTLRSPITVHVDQATVLKLPERAATLVIGNPLIADAAVQSGTLVITAKSYGRTNLVVLDRAGGTVAEFPIQAVGAEGPLVVVYRGIERETYSCAPKCERRITLGDSLQYFTQNLTALTTFSAQVLNDQKKQ